MHVRVEIRGSGNRLAESALRRAWARCLMPAGASVEPDAVLPVVLDDDPAVVAAAYAAGDVAYGDLAAVVHEVSPRVTDLALRVRALDDVLLLHAGGVCDAAGRTALIVGPSGAGKTTAVRRLAPRFGYVSDETIPVADDLSITPHPKPFSVLDRADRWKSQHAPDDLGAGPTPAAARAAAIVVLDRRAEQVGVEVEELDPLEAIGLLAAQCAFLAARPFPLRRLAALVDAAGPVRRVRYAEADDLAPLIEQWLEPVVEPTSVVELVETPAPTTVVEPVETPAPTTVAEPAPSVVEPASSVVELVETPAPGSEPEAPTYRLAPFHDLHVAPDGRAALLRGDQYLVTSPEAGAVLAHAYEQGSVTPAGAAAALERVGSLSSTSATEVAASIVQQLADLGILTPGDQHASGV